jgi:hypothetical protein
VPPHAYFQFQDIEFGHDGAIKRSSRSHTLIRSSIMGIGSILLIILVLCVVGALPAWPHSANWGYYPSGGLGVVLVVVLVLVLV